jgi:hypothetical protein
MRSTGGLSKKKGLDLVENLKTEAQLQKIRI